MILYTFLVFDHLEITGNFYRMVAKSLIVPACHKKTSFASISDLLNSELYDDLLRRNYCQQFTIGVTYIVTKHFHTLHLLGNFQSVEEYLHFQVVN